MGRRLAASQTTTGRSRYTKTLIKWHLSSFLPCSLTVPVTQARLGALGVQFAAESPAWARRDFFYLAAQFRETVSFLTLPNFGETFAKFALISLQKKGRGVSEGPRREKNSEKSHNTTHFRHHGHWYNHTCHWFGRNAQIPL